MILVYFIISCSTSRDYIHSNIFAIFYYINVESKVLTKCKKISNDCELFSVISLSHSFTMNED